MRPRKCPGPGTLSFMVISVIVVSSLALLSPKVGGLDDIKEEGGFEEPDFHSDFKQYFDYDSMTYYLKTMEQRYPDLMNLWSLGKTHEGREIWCAKLSDNAMIADDGKAGSEPNVLLVGAHHANEWISYETALYVMAFLLENYGKDDENGTAATYLLDNREIFIVPMLNPDGTQYAHETDRGWRKNREPNFIYDNSPGSFLNPQIHPVSYGVDLNRNYGWMWHEMGGSNIILSSSSSYRGPPDNKDDDGDAVIQVNLRKGILPGPDEGVDEDPWDGIDNDGDGLIDEDPAGGFSSEETIAMKKLGDEYQFPVAITYHSYSELILWPWSYDAVEAPDGPQMEQLGTRMAEMNGYRPMQAFELYKVTGDMTDWFYAQYGTFAYTFEIGRTHNIPSDEIIEHAAKNIDPTLYLIYSSANPLVSYIRTDENSTRIWRSGDHMRVEWEYIDEGYPIPLSKDSFNVVYSWENGPWKKSPLNMEDNGNLTGRVPVEMDQGKLELYFEMADNNGNIITEPAYAPYDTLVFDLERDSIFGLYFGFDTILVMLFTLGTAWGGFSVGVTRSLRVQKNREETNG